MYCERCEMCGNRWQRIPLTMVARDPETTLSNRTVLASAGKRPLEIERTFCLHGHGKHDDAGHTATEPILGMLDVQYNLRTQTVGVEGVDANMVPTGDDETPCL